MQNRKDELIMIMINKAQIKIIHVLISKMHIPDENYRDMLSSYGVDSSKELSFTQATEFINLLARMAEKNGVYIKYEPAFSRMGNRNDMAYPNQLRKIKALWFEKSKMQSSEDKLKALNSFLKNKFKIDRIEWLPRKMVGKVIKSIESIKV